MLPRAQRDMKKIESKETQQSLLKTCTDDLEQNPRPYGYESVKGVKGNIGLYRVYSEDRKYRIIYAIEDDLRAVIIVAVRRRNESTYKDTPVKSISAKIGEIAQELKVTLPLIRNLAVKMGIEWISELTDNQIRCLDIGIKAIKDGRSSPPATAEQVRVAAKVTEDIKTMVNDLKRLLHEM
jgi:mRNA-degrading endonuclease RelE of RelBE toxin-antitoxin system